MPVWRNGVQIRERLARFDPASAGTEWPMQAAQSRQHRPGMSAKAQRVDELARFIASRKNLSRTSRSPLFRS